MDAHRAPLLAAIPAGQPRSAFRTAKGERGIWQRRFWAHMVSDTDDFARHLDHVHFKPVKHGLVTRAIDWPYSSFKRAVARGHYPADWARAANDGEGFEDAESGPG